MKMAGVRFKADKEAKVSTQLAEPWNSADTIADCKFLCVFKERPRISTCRRIMQ